MEPIVGQSEAIRQIDHLVSTLATTDETVCIYGEHGTGKTEIAKTIHARDPRRAGRPFVVLHCATLSADPAQWENKNSNLFDGTFQLARRGTLVLRNVAALSATSQAELLEAIDEDVAADTGVRVIATITTDLFSPMEQGGFHRELSRHRAGFTITVPPLRERKEDIPCLVTRFIHSFNLRHCRDVQRITRHALQILLKHHWPGNVRELKCCIEHACMRTDQPAIDSTVLVAAIAALKAGVNLDDGVSGTPNEESLHATQGVPESITNGSQKPVARMSPPNLPAPPN